MRHRHTGYVHRPHLVGLCHRDLAQEIGEHLVSRLRLRGSQPAHQRQIGRRCRSRQIVDAAPADPEYLRLPRDRKVLALVDHRFLSGNRPALPSAPDIVAGTVAEGCASPAGHPSPASALRSSRAAFSPPQSVRPAQTSRHRQKRHPPLSATAPATSKSGWDEHRTVRRATTASSRRQLRPAPLSPDKPGCGSGAIILSSSPPLSASCRSRAEIPPDPVCRLSCPPLSAQSGASRPRSMRQSCGLLCSVVSGDNLAAHAVAASPWPAPHAICSPSPALVQADA
jgi:hypothetical protein